MQRFRRFFALLFILSLFVGAVHELSHTHHQGDVCEVCILAHAPGLLGNTPTLTLNNKTYELFQYAPVSDPIAPNIILRNRAPPIS